MSTRLSREEQVKNLGAVGGRKLARLLDWARKVGQLRHLHQTKFYINKEIERELRDIELIVEDLKSLGVEMSE